MQSIGSSDMTSARNSSRSVMTTMPSSVSENSAITFVIPMNTPLPTCSAKLSSMPNACSTPVRASCTPSVAPQNALWYTYETLRRGSHGDMSCPPDTASRRRRFWPATRASSGSADGETPYDARASRAAGSRLPAPPPAPWRKGPSYTPAMHPSGAASPSPAAPPPRGPACGASSCSGLRSRTANLSDSTAAASHAGTNTETRTSMPTNRRNRGRVEPRGQIPAASAQAVNRTYPNTATAPARNTPCRMSSNVTRFDVGSE